MYIIAVTTNSSFSLPERIIEEVPAPVRSQSRHAPQYKRQRCTMAPSLAIACAQENDGDGFECSIARSLNHVSSNNALPSTQRLWRPMASQLRASCLINPRSASLRR